MHRRSTCRWCTHEDTPSRESTTVTLALDDDAPAACSYAELPLEHGTLVDAQLVEYATDAAAFASRYGTNRADPCVYALLTYVHDVCRWRIVAAQVPLYVPALDVATGIDLVCTDAATGCELHVLELKASANGTDGWELYQHAPSAYARTGPFASLFRSRYSAHQLQLWGMWHALARDARLEVTSASVVRVSPRVVRVYALDAWFREHDTQLVTRLCRAIARRVQKQQQQYKGNRATTKRARVHW